MTSLVRADVCIVGGGIVGCATAFQLARRGVDVLLLERAWVGAGSSSRGMGGIRHQFADELDVRLVQASVPLWKTFTEDTGAGHVFDQRGYLFIAETEAGLSELRSLVDPLRRWNVDARMVERAEIAELVPGIRVEDLAGGRYCADDGYGDPATAVRGFAEAAQRHGARIREEQNVTRILVHAGRVSEIESSTLRVVATQTLVACGAWTADVLASCDVEVPIWPYRRQLARAGPFADLAVAPMTIEWESGLHFRPKGHDQLFAMPNLARDGAIEKAPAGPAPAAPMIVDQRALAWTKERAARRHPAFRDLKFSEAWACYYEMTPDDHPILGRIESVEGLFVAAGFSGHGFMQSPAVSVCMAELLIDGRARTVDISGLGLERFRSASSAFRSAVL
jgi:sarcosine oxidase subunit beta